MTSLLSPPPPPPPLSDAAIPLPSIHEDDMASPPVPSCAGASLSEPPTYTPSAEVPPYSDMPGPSECTLAVTARSCRRMPSGVLVRSNGLVTLALRGQEEHAPSPSYGRHGRICGDIGLSCTQGVQSIYITLEGQLRLATPDGARIDGSFFSASFDIWTRPEDDVDGRGQCPSLFPLNVVLPETFQDKGARRPLPPSHDILYSYAADICATCSYVMRVVVERRGSKLGIWKLPKKLEVPFVYQPRTRAPQPILALPFPFLSTVKSSPEEWFQITSTIAPKDSSEVEPIDCHFFIPIVQTFALADTIPFYLQLIAPSKSLQAFLRPTVSADIKSKRSKIIAACTTTPPMVRVYLLRQVIMVVRGQLCTVQFSIGEGNVRSLPPGASWPPLLRSQPLDCGLSTLDYEGEVHPNSDIKVGQFGMSRLQVRDFITTYLSPPHPSTSPLRIHQHSHPICLVTDRFTGAVD